MLTTLWQTKARRLTTPLATNPTAANADPGATSSMQSWHKSVRDCQNNVITNFPIRYLRIGKREEKKIATKTLRKAPRVEMAFGVFFVLGMKQKLNNQFF